MPMPDVSVVVPSFNDGHLIDRCLASILGQSQQPLEVIVVDDGSTDRAALAGLEEARVRFPTVRFVRQGNAGPSAARNRGLAEASGRWIAFVDADDELTPDSLEIRRQRAEQEPQADAVYCAVTFIEPDGRSYGSNYRTQSERFANDLIGARGGVPGFLWAYLIRTDLVRAVGGLNETLTIMEDYDLLGRLGLAGAWIVGDARQGYIQHRRLGSLARGSAWRQIRGALVFLGEARRRRYFSRANLFSRYARVPRAGLKVWLLYGLKTLRFRKIGGG